MQNQTAQFFDLTPIPHVTLDSVGKITAVNPAAEALLGQPATALINVHLVDFIDNTDQHQFQEWLRSKARLATPLIVRLYESRVGQVYVQLLGCKIDGTLLIALAHLATELVQPSHDYQHAAFINASNTKLLNQLDTTEMRRLIVTQALNDSVLAITSTLDFDTVLDKILENVGRAIPHNSADIMLVEGNTAFVARSRGYEKHGLHNIIDSLRFPIDATPTLRQMQYSKNPIIISDMHHNGNLAERPKQQWMRAYMGAPIQFGDEVIGFINLVSNEPNTFVEEHLKWLNAFAAHAAVAIHNARLHEQVHALAVAEERQRMAREIHDSVSQMLFSSSMIAESLASGDITDGAILHERLQHIYRLNRGAVAEMRLLLMEYKPENLASAEIPILLQRLKETVEGRTTIEIELDIDDGHPTPPVVRLAFYRIAQEALHNIAKHAVAKQAYVRYVTRKAYATMVIADKGSGFDTAQETLGHGLQNMRERAMSINAMLTVESRPKEGTTITVHWLSD
jgi:signal transduction histidine kinase